MGLFVPDGRSGQDDRGKAVTPAPVVIGGRRSRRWRTEPEYHRPCRDRRPPPPHRFTPAHVDDPRSLLRHRTPIKLIGKDSFHSIPGAQPKRRPAVPRSYLSTPNPASLCQPLSDVTQFWLEDSPLRSTDRRFVQQPGQEFLSCEHLGKCFGMSLFLVHVITL
jgi:hypothetical protein